MNRKGSLAAGFAAALAFSALPAAAEGTFRLVVDTVTESRARTAANDTSGRLTFRPRLEGEGLGEVKAFRIHVSTAVDDTGRSLVPEEPEPLRWEDDPKGPGLWIVVDATDRAAASATIAGTIELWAPGRDPGAEVRVPNALARPGRPIASAGLRAAGLSLRAAATGSGVSVAGRPSDVDRVRTLRVVGSDGSEIPSSGVQRVTDGETGRAELILSGPPPADATLVLGLLTKKSLLSVPFELKEVALP